MPDAENGVTVAVTHIAQPGDGAATLAPVPPRRQAAEDAQTIAGPPPGVTVESAITVFGDPRTIARATSPATAARPNASPPASRSDEAGPLEPGQSFGSRYHIIRALGVGGMGAVYQAWDAELGVAVAIKVIRPEIMADPGAAAEVERRFKRELLLARQVTHKNVVRIYDLGEIGGIKYITMSYVEGTELATLLRQGKLAVPAVVRIARAIVSGLVAAHTAGVVHRDLKPANIMIDRAGDALIMDFGIARSTGSPAERTANSGPSTPTLAASARADATMQGTVVGTIEYMAPEQARGQPADQRADIYALGLILYDALLGKRRAERAESAVAELQQRMAGAPPPIKSLVSEVPAALAEVVGRCLEPDPAKRYQTAAELGAALDRLDEDGEPIPIRRVLGVPAVSAVVAVLLALSAGTWWYQRQFIPPAAHDPVSVVIADLQNNTGDTAFDRTLEPMLKRALEGAGFITAYDRSGITRTLGVRPPDTLDEAAAREIAVRQGLGVVLSGAVDRQGSGFGVSVKAAQAVTGDVITSAKGRASTKDQVLETTTKLVTTVRKALGDETSTSAQLFAMASVSATSLDVVSHYAAAREAASKGRFEEARARYLKAVELDPKFGIGYQALASVSQGLGNLQDAEKYIKEALRYLDNMTERERYTTRGAFDFLSGDYSQCVKEYSDLIGRYSADVAGHNNLALCLTYLRRMPEALTEMRRVVELVPKQAVFRANLALYASYASDFQSGEQEARKIDAPDAKSILAVAFAQLGQGRIAQASDTYQKLKGLDAQGASFAALGLGDVAILEGRFADAVRLLSEGAAADLDAKNPDRAAAKFNALAYAHLLRGERTAAVAATAKALANSNTVPVRFLAARTLVEAGELPKARPLIADLAGELQAEPQAYAKLLEGQIALTNGDARQAIKVLAEANTLFDTWIGHFDLGRAYLRAGAFAQADGEFDRCIKRRGEALSLFLDEDPTYAYFPAVFYYQGRVREELKSDGFRESYRQYLTVRGSSTEDALVRDARQRSGQ